MKKPIPIRFWGIFFSLVLSSVVFILFSFPDLLDFFAKLRAGTSGTSDANKFIISALQSFIVFLIGSFLSIFLDRFTRIEQNIANTATRLLDELPVLIESKAEHSAIQLNAQLSELRKNLAEGMVRTGAFVYRSLRYDEITGILYNHTSNDPAAPRNVLFNNKTISYLLSTAVEMGADLEAIGFKCGAGFGQFLNVHLKKSGGKDISFVNAIDLWIEYDSNAGFGRFEREGGDLGRITAIVLKHNFLTEPPFQTPEARLCTFITGYLNGVLDALPHDTIRQGGYIGGQVAVSHDPFSEDCACTNKNQPKGCRWKIVERMPIPLPVGQEQS
jgi:hypothetical protein